MSLYSEKLAKLKREISIIKLKKTKKLKPEQKKMDEFVNGYTDSVEFTVNGNVIVLEKGDSNKGFVLIIEKHYAPNDLEAVDILNLPLLFENALKLNTVGKTLNALTAYQITKNQKILKLITNETRSQKLVVTTYKKS